ncbi:MAG: MOSC N-terminal beta barrel domain-containing protein, partial [Pseudomonadota bacterium]
MGTLAHIYRHPIKAHGSEALESVELTANATLPWDRVWAVAHEKSKADGSEWARCGNFSRGAHVPTLMAVTCRFDEASEEITLSHPALPDLTANPDTGGAAIIDWISQVMPADARKSTRVLRAQSAAEGQGLTDNPEPYLSILGLSSLRTLSGKAGRDLSPLRFRGNLWVEGLGPWEEFEWVGKSLRIGAAEFSVEDRIDRCPATMVNPETGRKDTDTLDLLREG